MAIHIGSNEIGKLYFGNNEIDKIYLGNNLIWEGIVVAGDKPSYSTISRVYNGQPQDNGYTAPSVGVTVTGDTSGTNAGTYVATYTLQEGYCWSDGTRDTCTITMTIIVVNSLCFTANTAGSTIGINVSYTPSVARNFQYSIDGTTWNEFIIGTTVVTLTNVGDRAWFKGNNPNGINEYVTAYHKFVMTGSIAASGNIMSLIDDGACSTMVIPQPPIPGTGCFQYIFQGCTSLTSAPSLPATTLTSTCYCGMFQGCTSLTSMPQLPATTLKSSCYENMFTNCTALTTVTQLPATTLNGSCYEGMFSGCTSLVTPPLLPATTLANYCYDSMFYGCTSLTTAPALPATTLAEYCYEYMFRGCTSLTTSPQLPATTLFYSCYQSMFYGCTSLITPPALPATTLVEYCYRDMFRGCTSLYVSDSSGSGYSKPWYIPSGSTGSGDYDMDRMFTDCLGTRSTNSPNFNGVQKVYYTQNQPVGNLTSGNFSCTSTYADGCVSSGTVTNVPAAIIMANKGRTVRMSYDTYSKGDFVCNCSPTDWQYKRFGIHGSCYIDGSVAYPLTGILECGLEGHVSCEWTIPTSATTITDLQANIQVNYASGYTKPASTNPATWYIKNVVIEII